jgi:hypothetical protein
VGCGCYQDLIGLFQPGALELIVAAVTVKLTEWSFDSGAAPNMLL